MSIYKLLSEEQTRNSYRYIALGTAILMALSSASLMAAKISVPQTGQVKCYASDGVATGQIACANTGQDGDLRAGMKWPVPRFTDNGDGTVKDNLSGLIWLKDASCGDLATTGDGSATFAEALLAVNNLSDLAAGSDCGLSDSSSVGDWRLPNVREIQSLITRGYLDPAVPNTSGAGQWTEGNPFADIKLGYWTSTTNGMSPTKVYAARFDFGAIATSNKDWSDRFIWPVKGQSNMLTQTGQSVCFDPSGTTSDTTACAGTGQDGDLQMGVALPTPRFTDKNDGTVIDNLTGLVWLKDSDCFSLQTWEQALSSAISLSDTGSAIDTDDCGLSDRSALRSWRLPNILELSSLIHFGYADSAYSGRAISNAAGTGPYNEQQDDPFTFVRIYVWSSTSNDSSPTSAIRMKFSAGEEQGDIKSATYGVWLVRDSLDEEDSLLLLIPAIISASKKKNK